MDGTKAPDKKSHVLSARPLTRSGATQYLAREDDPGDHHTYTQAGDLISQVQVRMTLHNRTVARALAEQL